MPGSIVNKTYGTVSTDKQVEMSGLEFVEGLVNGTLPLNTMAETLGYDVVEVAKGRVVATALPHNGHRNPAGTVHGGLAATLLDSCMGLAIQSTLEKGIAQTTVELKLFAHPTYHTRNRLDQSRRRRPELWPPYRNRGRADHRSGGTVTRPWDDNVPDL